MQDLAVVGVLKRLGHPSDPPGDRVGVGPSGERLSAGGALHQGAVGRLDAVQQLDEVGARAGGPDRRIIEDLEERDPAEIGHAEQVQTGRRVGSVRVDGDDVGVLEPRQRLRLTRAGSRHLQGDGPVGQMLLFREIDPRECASAQLLDQPEPRDRLAGLRERSSVAAGSRAIPVRGPGRSGRESRGLPGTSRRCRGTGRGIPPPRAIRRPPRGGNIPRKAKPPATRCRARDRRSRYHSIGQGSWASPSQDEIGSQQREPHGRSLLRVIRQILAEIRAESGRGPPVGLVPLNQQGDGRR